LSSQIYVQKKYENFRPFTGILQNCIFTLQHACNEISNTLKTSVTDLHNVKISSAGEFWFQA